MSNMIVSELFHQLHSNLSASEQSEVFTDTAPILIYGAGNVGKDVCRLLSKQGISIRGFLDQNATQDSQWQGIPIWKPENPVPVSMQREHCHVVVGIFNLYSDIFELTKVLNSLGYARVSTFQDVHAAFPSELGDRFWLTNRSYYLDKEKLITSASGLFEDDLSREIFFSILRARFTNHTEAFPKPSCYPQYFSPDIPGWRTPLRFIDCGAFDGDTLKFIADNGIQIERAAAFEPDPVNFVKLANYVRSQRTSLEESVSLFPCGVHSATEQIRFSSGQGSGSHASSSGDIVIQCVSVDEALPGFRPNLIKMDIEGAEYAALWGARQTIIDQRPGLAICLYHCPEHLWQIPLLIHDWNLGYRFYLRVYAYNGFELVLYAMPT